ncbi:MAG: division/cell wall cluster transcriptional repressor MraZ [Gammaproteobacteria bacterium]
MFRGFSAISLDAKGRLAIPSRYRERLTGSGQGVVVATLNPFDLCAWLYPLSEWELIDAKLQDLPSDRSSRRARQMMRAYAYDCELDRQGRILLPQALREFAGLEKDVAVLGQGNKLEVWDARRWEEQRADWLKALEDTSGEPSNALSNLSL